MAATGTKIIGFVPSPDTAATVVAWVQALADEGEETIFLCYENGFDGGTERAVRQALTEEGGDALTTITIDENEPMAICSTQDLNVSGHQPWNKGKLIGQKPPLKPKQSRTHDDPTVRSAPVFLACCHWPRPLDVRHPFFAPHQGLAHLPAHGQYSGRSAPPLSQEAGKHGALSRRRGGRCAGDR